MQLQNQNSQIEYKVEGVWGEGLNSWVYRAFKQDCNETFCQPVALKVFKSKTSDQLLRQDYESLMRVHSPYCVRVFGFDVFNGHPALVLEPIEGMSFLEKCLGGDLTEVELESIVNQILEGLIDIHKARLFHGDLSPNNILITEEAQVKLIDFGISNQMRSGYINATLDFMDPRLLQGESMDTTHDFFSLSEIYRFALKFVSKLDFDLERINKNRELLKRGEPLPKPTTKKSKVRPLEAVLMVMIAAVIMIFCPLSSNSSSLTPVYSQIHVRTKKWLKVRINHQEKGYSPLSAYVPSGKLLVEWSQNGEFQSRTLTIGEGENIVLNDSFFEPSPAVSD